jgi:hypothetical protein
MLFNIWIKAYLRESYTTFGSDIKFFIELVLGTGRQKKGANQQDK